MTNAACRVYNDIHHIPFSAVADLDGGDWLRRISPRHDRDHRFSAGYPSFKKEGAVSGMGIIRPVSPETNCDRDKSAPVARDWHKSPNARAP
jgi:hypothetical protein